MSLSPFGGFLVSVKGSTIFEKKKCPKFSTNKTQTLRHRAQELKSVPNLVCDFLHGEEGMGTTRSPDFPLGLLISENLMLKKLLNSKCSFAVD